MKKIILFMVINMNIGGTEKALLNMLAEMPKDKYNITIFLLEEYGGFLKNIPSEVRVEYFKGYEKIKGILNEPPQFTAFSLFKQGKIFKSFNTIFLHLISKALKDRSIFFKYVLWKYPSLITEYDVAIAFDGPMDFISYFVINKIKAKKRIQWIHFDISKIGFNKKFAAKIYNKFHKVFVVSHEARDKLIDAIPRIKEKTEVFTNLVSWDLINSQAQEGIGFTDKFDGLRILTVGRLTIEKGQDMAIRVLARLIEKGFNVRWYCVGEGSWRKEFEKLVEEYKLQDNFILLGAITNPYPFIQQCDLYVQPSRHEGYCIALAEARCLKKPIITTNFAGAKEQIKHGETGLIVNFDEEQIYNATVELINNNKLGKKFSYNLAQEKTDSTIEMTKLYRIVN